MNSCPDCAAELDLAPDLEEGEIVVCPDCGVESGVMNLDPITIELAPEIEAARREDAPCRAARA